MNFVRLLPVFLSSLVLAAHFFRSGTAGSSLVFRMRALRQRYALDSGSGTDSSTVSQP